jgi:PKD repeat protein
MKIKNLLRQGIIALSLFFYVSLKAQVPVANFSVTPNPACTNTNNAVQIIDLSTNSPTAWSYTVAIFGPGPGGTAVYNTQNPTVSFNFPGTYTITLVSTNAAGSSATHSQTLTVLRSPNANINPANVNSCIGATPVTINVNAVGPGAASDTFSWSTGATSNSITVSPNVTTTFVESLQREEILNSFHRRA